MYGPTMFTPSHNNQIINTTHGTQIITISSFTATSTNITEYDLIRRWPSSSLTKEDIEHARRMAEFKKLAIHAAHIDHSWDLARGPAPVLISKSIDFFEPVSSNRAWMVHRYRNFSRSPSKRKSK